MFDGIGGPLLITVAIQLSVQAYKVVFYSLRNHELELSRFVSAGGMPSAHSAFVVALVVTLALSEGLESSAVAVAVVLAAVVIFDGIRVRGAIERNTRLLAQLVHLLPEQERPGAGPLVGHSLAEVAAGVIVGGGLGAVGYYLFLA